MLLLLLLLLLVVVVVVFVVVVNVVVVVDAVCCIFCYQLLHLCFPRLTGLGLSIWPEVNLYPFGGLAQTLTMAEALRQPLLWAALSPRPL